MIAAGVSFIRKLAGKQKNNADPMRIFEVKKQRCILCHVHVIKGKNITKGTSKFLGFKIPWDKLDTPDPYVMLDIENSSVISDLKSKPDDPDDKKWTDCITDNPNPDWNEKFVFVLDPEKTNDVTLDITLMEGNPGNIDSEIGKVSYKLFENVKMNEAKTENIKFNGKGEVEMKIGLKYGETNLRYSQDLPSAEKNFRKKRFKNVLTCMQEVLGKEKGPRTVEEVPVVAVLGSGGGYRAMIGFSGAIRALEKRNILDCTTYIAGLSGSTWYMSSLYSHPQWPELDTKVVKNELRKNAQFDAYSSLYDISSLSKYFSRLKRKHDNGQPVTFVDFYGLVVGEALLRDRAETATLSQQQDKLKDGRVPMPLYASLNVKSDVSAKIFQEWVEYTPYEIGIPKYGCYMKSKDFGSKFFMGKICKTYPEMPLHYMQGCWGSAFSILYNNLMSGSQSISSIEESVQADEQHQKQSNHDHTVGKHSFHFRNTEDKKVKKVEKDRDASDGGVWNTVSKLAGEMLLSDRCFRSALIHNFMQGLNPFQILSAESKSEIFTAERQYLSEAIVDENEFSHVFEPGPQIERKPFHMVDAGLAYNSPYPLLLRKPRSVDLIISFDFSAREKDNSQPLSELLLACKWALLHKIPFPLIDEKYKNDPVYRDDVKEVYVFGKEDPNVPIVIHFALINKDFRKYKKVKENGELVERDDGDDSAQFSLFDKPETRFLTKNFQYEEKDFNLLSNLVKFNTLQKTEEIKECLAECVARKRKKLRLREVFKQFLKNRKIK